MVNLALKNEKLGYECAFQPYTYSLRPFSRGGGRLAPDPLVFIGLRNMIKCINCFKNCLFPVIYNRCISLLLGLREYKISDFIRYGNGSIVRHICFTVNLTLFLRTNQNWYEIDQIAQILIIT